MNNTVMAAIVALAIGVGIGVMAAPEFGESAQFVPPPPAPAAPALYSAVKDSVGAQDVSGPYEVVQNWPQDLAELPGHEKWTYGGARSVFAESPDRVFLLGGGELVDLLVEHLDGADGPVADPQRCGQRRAQPAGQRQLAVTHPGVVHQVGALPGPQIAHRPAGDTLALGNPHLVHQGLGQVQAGRQGQLARHRCNFLPQLFTE